MNSEIKTREKKTETEETERLHSEALVIDTLIPNSMRCLPGEVESCLVEKLIREGVNISEIGERIGDLQDKQWLRGTANPWDWWEQSGVDVIHTTLGIPSEGVSEWEAYRKTIKDLARFTLRFDKSDKLVKITKADDIVRAKREGKYGVILGVQNLNCLAGDLNNMELFYNLGLRIMQLTYNLRNLAGNGCTERRDEGLSEFGIKAIRKMNDLGILVDLSHCGIRTTLEAIEASKSPVAFTHTFCKAVHDHDRGKTDEELEALKKNNGYMGILILPDFITDKKKPSLEDFLDHIDHAIEILGTKKIGIGTDHGAYYLEQLGKLNREKRKKEIEEWGVDSNGWRRGHFKDEGPQPFVQGYRDWRDFPNITKALRLRGYSSEQIMDILGQNFLRVFRETVG